MDPHCSLGSLGTLKELLHTRTKWFSDSIKTYFILQVFKLVSGHVTLGSLQLILGVLEPKSTKEELMENEEEQEGGGEDSGGEGEGSEMDEDERGSLVSEDTGSEDDEAEQGEEEGEEVDPAFRAEVQKALGAAAVDSDAEVFLSLILLWHNNHSECCMLVE